MDVALLKLDLLNGGFQLYLLKAFPYNSSVPDSKKYHFHILMEKVNAVDGIVVQSLVSKIFTELP